MDRRQFPVSSGTGKRKAALVDTFIPEFSNFLSGESVDLLLTPWPRRAPGQKRYRWPLPAGRVKAAWWTAMRRSLYERRAQRLELAPSEVQVTTAEWLAQAYKKLLSTKVEHLFIEQNLLPFLWREGVLQGRTYDVLLTRLPWFERQRRVSEAGLSDVEVPQWLVEVEKDALGAANRVITPHADFASLFENVRRVEWAKAEVLPPAQVPQPKYLLFPASLRERQGAQAALQAARATGMSLVVVGGDPEHQAMADDPVIFTSANDVPWHEIAAVVHPTLFEAWPRLHLQALALDIPVIASAGVGLDESEISLVEFGDVDGLFRTLTSVIARDLGPGREPLDLEPDAHRLFAAVEQVPRVEARPIQAVPQNDARGAGSTKLPGIAPHKS